MIKYKKSIKKSLIFSLIVLVVFQYNVFSYEQEEDTDYIWLKEEITNVSNNPSDEPKLNSKCAVVFDRSSKTVLFGKNENKRVPMASTTKIMTAIVLLENLSVNNSNLDIDTKIEVCKEVGAIGGSRLGLKYKDRISINDLLYGLMLCSRE